MATTPTAYMGLELPNPANATNPEAGPLWATDLNVAFTAVDAHDHTTGSGVPVPSAGLRINADVPFTYAGTHYGPTSAGYYGFFPQTAPTPGSHTSSLYVNASGALYYRSAGGTDIAIASNTALANTGTGAYNGFYGDYAGVGVASAVAFYRTATESFEFYSPLGAGSSTPANYTQLTGLTAKSYAAQNSAVASLAFVNFDPAATVFGAAPMGGWALTNPNAVGKGFAFGLDSTTGLVGGADGTYANAVLGVYNATAYAVPGKWGFSVNRPETDGTFKGRAANPLDIWLYGTATAAPQAVSTFTSLTSGTPVAGYGNRVAFLAGGAAWSGYGNATPTLYTHGAIDSFFQSATVANGAGLRLRGAYAGTLSTTAGIEVVALSAGVDSIGLGGAATADGTVTLYGSMAPNAAATVGTNTAPFGNMYFTNWRSGAAATPLSAIVGSTTLVINPSGNTTLNTGFAATGAVTGSRLIASSTAVAGTASWGTDNNVRAWGRVTIGNVVTAGYNVTSSTISTPSGNLRKFSIVFANAVNANDCIIAAVDSTDVTNVPTMRWATLTSATTAEILIDNGGGTVTGIYFQVVGS